MHRNHNIDFIKGLAIFGIVLCHASQIIPDINIVIKKLCQLGQLGCQVFFFFTGYLLLSNFNNNFLSHSLSLSDLWGGGNHTLFFGNYYLSM